MIKLLNILKELRITPENEVVGYLIKGSYDVYVPIFGELLKDKINKDFNWWILKDNNLIRVGLFENETNLLLKELNRLVKCEAISVSNPHKDVIVIPIDINDNITIKDYESFFGKKDEDDEDDLDFLDELKIQPEEGPKIRAKRISEYLIRLLEPIEAIQAEKSYIKDNYYLIYSKNIGYDNFIHILQYLKEKNIECIIEKNSLRLYINEDNIEIVNSLDENLDELRILPEEKFIKFKYNYDDGFYYSEFINDETDGYFPWILQENKVGKEYLYCKVDKIDAKIIEEILRNYFKITDWDIFPDRVSDRYHILIYNFIEDKDT